MLFGRNMTLHDRAILFQRPTYLLSREYNAFVLKCLELVQSVCKPLHVRRRNVTSQKNGILNDTAVKTSKLAQLFIFLVTVKPR